MDYKSKLLETLELLSPGVLDRFDFEDQPAPFCFIAGLEPELTSSVFKCSIDLRMTVRPFDFADTVFEHLSWNAADLYRVGVLIVAADSAAISAVKLVRWLQQAHPDRFTSVVLTGNRFDSETLLLLSDAGVQVHRAPLNDAGVKRLLAESVMKSIERRSCALVKATSILRLSTLTQQEMLVMLQTLRGMTSKEIGVALGNSSRTVEIHRGRVLDKLNVRNAVQLAMAIHGAFRP